jgi:hypothetical protein
MSAGLLSSRVLMLLVMRPLSIVKTRTVDITQDWRGA